MTTDNRLEQDLRELGERLRELPELAPRVMEGVRKLPPSVDSVSAKSTCASSPRRWLWRIVPAACTLLVLAALAIVMFSPGQSLVWAQVQGELANQAWIRGTLRKQGRLSVFWFSPRDQVWASSSPDSWTYSDGSRKIRYEYQTRQPKILKSLLPANEEQKYLSLQQSDESDSLGPWIMGEKIVRQSRRIVEAEGRNWIEYQIVVNRGSRFMTLRVDPRTRLPVFLTAADAMDGEPTFSWSFDYPEQGPADIFGLGVSADVAIDDRVPSDSAVGVLEAMAQARSAIGDFGVVTLRSEFRDQFRQYHVAARSGKAWRLDQCYSSGALFTGAESTDSWYEQFVAALEDGGLRIIPFKYCDGNSVFVWRAADGQPVSEGAWQPAESEGVNDFPGRFPGMPWDPVAAMYPEIIPQSPHWGFEFIPNPPEMPGCVLFKRSAELASLVPQMAHEWYYVDPARGHTVVRTELISLPLGAPADYETAKARSSIILKDFAQTLEGIWYPTLVSETQTNVNANDPSSQPRPFTTEYRVHLDTSVFLWELLLKVGGELPTE